MNVFEKIDIDILREDEKLKEPIFYLKLADLLK